ncbi:TetR/AcrR family transcriptional regulator [Parvularcula marina]|uniref:TetR/AcrR family transcriptional regulator n=1 Tax=Parvularcula marina TaxID=2292771 RepID=A0A371RIC2_9PROT|nr:TetR/AcrR family transcriptional regulator [Parvularcula marina]RFB05188.1 TetR/AcrR family transcriptional regulator [Parvularcula marina]
MSETLHRGRPRKFDEKAVLDAALEVFRRQGFSATSLDDLTAATGLNRPSLYGAFGNKEALFRSCVDHYWRTQGREYMRALFTGDTLAEGLGNMCRTFLDAVCVPHPGGCIVACCLPSASTSDLDHTEFLSDIFSQCDASVRKRLTRASKDGDIPQTADIETLAGYIVTTLFGFSLRARAGLSRDILDRQVELFIKTVANP